MLRTIKACVAISLRDLWLELAAVAGVWLLVELGTNLVTGYYFYKDGPACGTVGFAGALAVFGTAVMAAFINVGRVWMDFRRGLRLGATRRGLLAGEMLACVLHSLVPVGLALALAGVSEGIYRLLWQPRGVQLVFSVWTFMSPAVLALLLAGPVAVAYLIGAPLLKFGGKAGWVLWCIWMAVVLFDDQLSRLFGGVFGPFVAANPLGLGILGTAAALVYLVLCARWILRLPATGGGG